MNSSEVDDTSDVEQDCKISIREDGKRRAEEQVTSVFLVDGVRGRASIKFSIDVFMGCSGSFYTGRGEMSLAIEFDNVPPWYDRVGTSFDIIKTEGVGKASREKGKGEESGGRVEGDHCG